MNLSFFAIFNTYVSWTIPFYTQHARLKAQLHGSQFWRQFFLKSASRFQYSNLIGCVHANYYVIVNILGVRYLENRRTRFRATAPLTQPQTRLFIFVSRRWGWGIRTAVCPCKIFLTRCVYVYIATRLSTYVCVSEFDEFEVHGLHLRTRMNQSHHRSL